MALVAHFNSELFLISLLHIYDIWTQVCVLLYTYAWLLIMNSLLIVVA